MQGLPSPAALEDPIGHPLGGASVPLLLSPWERACPRGFRLAPGLLQSLSIDIQPGVYVDISVDELRDAAGLERIAGVLVLPSSDIDIQIGSSHMRAWHGKLRAVLLIGTRSTLRVETVHAKLASFIEVWPFALDSSTHSPTNQ